MEKVTKKRSKKAGLPPGTLVHIGEEKAGELKITVMDYDETNFQEEEARTVEECFAFRDKPTVTWINVEGVHRVEVIEKLGHCFGLHPLVLEDILNTNQRPKMEIYEGYVYIVLRMLYGYDSNGSVKAEQVSLILGSNFVISFQEGMEGDVFDPVRERIRSGKGLIRKMGPDYLAYSLIDIIVDNYFLILEGLG
jgi:magnesium transporter